MIGGLLDISRLLDEDPTDDQKRRASSHNHVVASLPYIADQTVIKQKHRFAKGCLIATVDRKASVRSTVAPKITSLNTGFSRRKNVPLNLQEIRTAQTPIQVPI